VINVLLCTEEGLSRRPFLPRVCEIPENEKRPQGVNPLRSGGGISGVPGALKKGRKNG
jgi:hypothetical protein